MIVDFHVHIEQNKDKQFMSAEEIISAMDEANIAVSVLLGNDQSDAGDKPPWADSKTIGVAVNISDEFICNYCKKYPNRLIGFTSIHPNRYQPERKVERSIKEFGMKGLKLYPHSGFYPNDPRLFSVYEKCIKYDIPVMIHTGIKAVRWQSLKYNDPVYVDDIATKYPDLKIIMCHCGYPWIENFMAVVHSNPNTYVDITFMEYIESVYQVDGFTEACIKRLLKIIGSKRMVWGTEGPVMKLPLFGKHGKEHYEFSKEFLVNRFNFLSEDDKRNILGNTACKILKLKNLTDK